jgi:hypothetical protein
VHSAVYHPYQGQVFYCGSSWCRWGSPTFSPPPPVPATLSPSTLCSPIHSFRRSSTTKSQVPPSPQNHAFQMFRRTCITQYLICLLFLTHLTCLITHDLSQIESHDFVYVLKDSRSTFSSLFRPSKMHVFSCTLAS